MKTKENQVINTRKNLKFKFTDRTDLPSGNSSSTNSSNSTNSTNSTNCTNTKNNSKSNSTPNTPPNSNSPTPVSTPSTSSSTSTNIPFSVSNPNLSSGSMSDFIPNQDPQHVDKNEVSAESLEKLKSVKEFLKSNDDKNAMQDIINSINVFNTESETIDNIEEKEKEKVATIISYSWHYYTQ